MERWGRMRSVETGAEAARVPPHDLDAERAVIGAMLVSETAVSAVAERLAAEDFYSEVHRIIYGAMTRLYSRGDPIDQLTLTNELRSVGEFEKVGGRAYVFQIVERLYEAEGEVTGVETGFEDLDRLTTGFHKSDLVILAARPAMGKTALALNAIWHAAGQKGMPVAIFSLEMSKEQLVQRLISQTTRIPAQALRSGNVKAEDWPRLVRGVAEVSRAPVWIDDSAGVTLMEIR